MVLADLALGLLNRSAQQLNVFFLLNAAQKYIGSTDAPDLIPLCSSSLFG